MQVVRSSARSRKTFWAFDTARKRQPAGSKRPAGFLIERQYAGFPGGLAFQNPGFPQGVFYIALKGGCECQMISFAFESAFQIYISCSVANRTTDVDADT
jgi:hypothetical protein